MVFLEHTQQAQTVAVPYELAASGDPVSLDLVSTVNRTVYKVPVTATLSAAGRYWNVTLTLTLPALQEGSYEYALRSANEVLATGCAKIGSYAAETEQYDKVIEYEQYDA